MALRHVGSCLLKRPSLVSAKAPRSVQTLPTPLRRSFSDDMDSAADDADAAATKADEVDNRWPLVKAPDGYCVHTPPPCAAWDLSCSTWKTIDRDSTLISNWQHPEDPEDYSRISNTEESFTRFDLMKGMNRMPDSTKMKMYTQYSEDPETWTVARLSSTYGVSQPRVQAILLLKEWEKRDRAVGLVTAEDDALEEAVHQAHIRSVRKLEGQEGVRLLDATTDIDSTKVTKKGPLGKFRTLREDEEMPETPDVDAHVKQWEEEFEARKKELAAQDSKHIRVKNKRYTFIIKDTSTRAVQ